MMKLLLLLFLIGNFQNAISKENSDDIEGGRNFPITVSIVSLLSNPEDYADSYIQTEGYFVLGVGYSYLCLQEDDLRSLVKVNCLYIPQSDLRELKVDLGAIDQKKIFVKGRFQLPQWQEEGKVNNGDGTVTISRNAYGRSGVITDLSRMVISNTVSTKSSTP